jgi:aspartate racemase
MIDPPVRHVEVGILSGSGPEAGHDLLGRVIALTREQLGAEFHGDVDALSVRLVSLPRLGLSMGLPGTDDDVWPELLAGAVELDAACDQWAIACNTLNAYANRLGRHDAAHHLVTLPDAVSSGLAVSAASRTSNSTQSAATPDLTVSVLGARPVADLGEWSPYRALPGAQALTPAQIDGLHDLILDIKRVGPTDDHRQRLADLADCVTADVVLLACTELPLVSERCDPERVVDATDLLARRLVSEALRRRSLR